MTHGRIHDRPTRSTFAICNSSFPRGPGKAGLFNQLAYLGIMMKIPLLLTAAAATVLLAGCGDKTSSQSQAVNPADVTNVLVESKRTADKTIDVSYLNQAVQLFNVQEGRNPKTLDELTPKYVAKLPDVPLGYKLNYDAAKGEVTVVRQ
jgi:hypothetical protein